MTRKMTITCHPGESLLEALRRLEIPVSSPCGGKGVCGKCTVEVEGVGRIRSCGYHPADPVSVQVPDPSPMQILTESYWPDPAPVTDSSPGDEYGLAVDIGTTTVAVFLEHLGEHRNLGVATLPNPQQPYGADVMSRIHYCVEREEGTRTLMTILNEGISQAALTLCKRESISPDRVKRIALAGNTTMLHLAAGVNPLSLAVYPFDPVFLEAKEVLGLIPGFPNAVAELMPSLSSFIGSDIVGGFAGVSWNSAPGWKFFLDIGTNGEIVLWNEERALACATAAGPAFEGARISCGMPGVEGAVSAINPDGKIETIGNKQPAGLCGSGLVDMAAHLLNSGQIDSFGYMSGETSLSAVFRLQSAVRRPPSAVRLVPQDIRELQLAKGAIAAGVEVLMMEAGIQSTDVSQVWLAGGFGYALHDWSAARIGLIPAGMENKLVRAGNTAGMGARLWLHSEEFRVRTASLPRTMEYIELSSHPEFNERFVMNMGF